MRTQQGNFQSSMASPSLELFDERQLSVTDKDINSILSEPAKGVSFLIYATSNYIRHAICGSLQADAESKVS